MFFRDNLEKVLAEAGAGLVLDVGGWADPFHRADYVLDCFSYETRGIVYHGKGILPETQLHTNPLPGERFRRETWVKHDICSSKPFPFPDKMFDFVLCSHTLEDVRDPIRVCEELVRVGKAGYIETPSRLVELTRSLDGSVGAGHHRWMVEMAPGSVKFLFKPHGLHLSRSTFIPTSYTFKRPAREKVAFLFWKDSFEFHEDAYCEAEDCVEFVRRLNIPPYYHWRDLAGGLKWRCRDLLLRSPLFRRPAPEGTWTIAKLMAWEKKNLGQP